MSASNNSNSGTHVLVFPYPAQGHMLALLDLTHQLAFHNLTITILVTPKNLPILTPLLTAHPDIQTLVLPFPSSDPSIPLGVENVRELGNSANPFIMFALGKLFDPIIRWFQSHPNPPVAIISDFFLGWTLRLACQLNIIRIAFFSTRVLLPLIFDHCWDHFNEVKTLDTVEFHNLPRNPTFKAKHLPSAFRLYKESDPVSDFMKDGLVANTSSWGCIFNSFDDMEGDYLDFLKRKMGHDRVFGIGPLCLLGTESSRWDDPTLSPNLNDPSLKWLDVCSDGSVLYVCFGSQRPLKRDQMEALALGLEKSGIRFLWVVKTGMTGQLEEGYGLIPDGFEERVAGRGLIVKGWAPQMAILNHKAVGGFLSHCGWNSVLEVIVSGVMILAWPMEADQYVNARLVVEEMGVGIRVCEGADSVPDSTELGMVISESLNECAQVKARAKELRDKALAALKSGGSSAKDLERLVLELTNLQVK